MGSAATVATVENPLPGIVWSLVTFAPPMARAVIAMTADVRRKAGDMRQRSLISTREALPLVPHAIARVAAQSSITEDGRVCLDEGRFACLLHPSVVQKGGIGLPSNRLPPGNMENQLSGAPESLPACWWSYCSETCCAGPRRDVLSDGIGIGLRLLGSPRPRSWVPVSVSASWTYL